MIGIKVKGYRVGALLQLLLTLSSYNIQTATSFGFPTPFTQNRASTNNNGNSNNSLSKIPVVICPGFGNDQIDYINPLEQGNDYGFATALTRRGFNPDLIKIMPLKRYEWVNVARGLFDIPNFYTGNCRPDGLGYGWYVQRLRQTIEEAYNEGGRSEKVILIGHSAGGWLARAALGDGSWDIAEEVVESSLAEEGINGDSSARASDRVRALFTIGAIHRPPAGDSASTCVTRGALSFLDKAYPGAYLAEEGVAYVSVGGDAVLGKQQKKSNTPSTDEIDEEKKGSQEVNDVYEVREGSASSVAYTSYSAVSGDGEMTGDGVVPLEWSLLEGSRTIVLDGVVHSINEAGTTLPTNRWYGADEVVDRWLSEALEEAGVLNGSNSESPFKSMLESFLPGI